MNQRFPHTCAVCGWHWVSAIEHPQTCPNPDCRSKRWDGREKKKRGPKIIKKPAE